jgi:alcohol dehydrogenase (cytochrome c)
VEWNGPTLDRLNNTLITGAVDACFIVKSGATQYTPGEATFGGTVEPDGPVTGWLTSLDSETGAVKWRYHAEKPVIAGVTPTAGGVTFTGDLAGNLLVFNSKTGELVHKAQSRGALAGGVVTYEIAGKQYVAFASGNVSRTAFGALGVPSVVIMTLNPSRAAAAGAGSTPGASASAAGATALSGAAAGTAEATAAARFANGRKVYNQVCVVCHGPDGNLIANHRLSAIRARFDAPATISYIKDPKAPMPKLFPSLLSEQDIVDVAEYVRAELTR